MSPKRHLAAAAAAALLLTGCNLFGGGDNEPNTGGFVDTYTPPYTEPKGTVHSADFFPLAANTQVPISGNVAGSVVFTAKGTDAGQPVNDSTATPSQTTLAGTVRIYPARTLAMPSGVYTVIPEVTTTTAQGDSGPVTEVDTTFYEKTAAAINLRGSADAEDGLRENPQPLFLKLPLTVGDSWDFSGGSDGVTSRGRMYVTGMETVTAGGKSRQALRLDQVIQISGSFDDSGLIVAVQGEVHQVVWLAEGVGQIKQTSESKLTSSAVVRGEGTQVALKQVVSTNVAVEMAGEPGPLAKAASPTPPGRPVGVSWASAFGGIPLPSWRPASPNPPWRAHSAKSAALPR